MKTSQVIAPMCYRCAETAVFHQFNTFEFWSCPICKREIQQWDSGAAPFVSRLVTVTLALDNIRGIGHYVFRTSKDKPFLIAEAGHGVSSGAELSVTATIDGAKTTARQSPHRIYEKGILGLTGSFLDKGRLGIEYELDLTVQTAKSIQPLGKYYGSFG